MAIIEELFTLGKTYPLISIILAVMMVTTVFSAMATSPARGEDTGGDILPAGDDPGLVPHGMGDALAFDGADDTVVVPDSDDLDITGGLTVEFWMEQDTPEPVTPPVGLVTPISNVYELQAMEESMGSHYYLTNDIDCSVTRQIGSAAHSKIAIEPVPSQKRKISKINRHANGCFTNLVESNARHNTKIFITFAGFIMVQVVYHMIICYIDIYKAIVVIICCTYSHGPAFCIKDPHLFSNILKRPISKIMV